ncbi:hypothetical protein HRbin29_01430 [bacterium HR29]|jgi:FlaG/FlaF family flagellin (archaellin)|nr:hypothetical protein HRbin29_01430 [bacterium HR29]
MVRSRTRRLLAVAIIAALAVAAFGFAASNTVPGSRAGDGSGTVSGYTVSNINYNLAAANPANIDSVSFTLDATAGDVYASVDNGSSWTSCTNTGGNNWSCDFSPDVPVLPVTSLRVVAAD